MNVIQQHAHVQKFMGTCQMQIYLRMPDFYWAAANIRWSAVIDVWGWKGLLRPVSQPWKSGFSLLRQAKDQIAQASLWVRESFNVALRSSWDSTLTTTVPPSHVSPWHDVTESPQLNDYLWVISQSRYDISDLILIYHTKPPTKNFSAWATYLMPEHAVISGVSPKCSELCLYDEISEVSRGHALIAKIIFTAWYVGVAFRWGHCRFLQGHCQQPEIVREQRRCQRGKTGGEVFSILLVMEWWGEWASPMTTGRCRRRPEFAFRLKEVMGSITPEFFHHVTQA